MRALFECKYMCAAGHVLEKYKANEKRALQGFSVEKMEQLDRGPLAATRAVLIND